VKIPSEDMAAIELFFNPFCLLRAMGPLRTTASAVANIQLTMDLVLGTRNYYMSDLQCRKPAESRSPAHAPKYDEHERPSYYILQ